MVWNSEQSPLYRSVEKYNHSTEEQPCSCSEEPPRKSPCEDKPPRSCTPKREMGFLQRLTSDRDQLLIIALIILLWHEKADMKLIAALVFILLG